MNVVECFCDPLYQISKRKCKFHLETSTSSSFTRFFSLCALSLPLQRLACTTAACICLLFYHVYCIVNRESLKDEEGIAMCEEALIY